MSLFKKTYGSNIKYHHARRGKEAVFEDQYGDDEKSYSNLNWGTLMAATCVNGNDGFYPYAFAIVLSENKDNWFWFLDNLQQVVDDRPIVFLSDRHEELLQGIPRAFPGSYHSYCFYHIKCNLPIGKGDANYNVVIDLFYKAAYSYTTSNFEEALWGMHAIGCGHVANYLRTIPKEKWENAFFPVCRYAAHSSSITESFNNWILEFKKLPAFALLDAIRLKVMQMNSKRMVEGLENFNTRLTLVYEDLLNENINIGRTWTVVESMERLYEVRWKVNGFPCAHACAAIQSTREDIYSFVEPYFTTEWYNRTYQEIILPIPNYDKPQSYDSSDRIIVPIHVLHPVDEENIVSRRIGKRKRCI
ncbi:uncharacterized protein LOC113279863 [Papaver somniferum]|uniref:uncharacterized protein LOC113279863 n=1 Tax=Papaver somniferum TaxID=3469 RepID=UPI000E6F78E2|nr:uncharacterized protein LOC113279863 [Papaver somniferum]